MPVLKAFRGLSWQWLLLLFGAGICAVAFGLQQIGVPSLATSSGGVLVTVYVKNPAARLLLRSFVFPNDPGRDTLAISVAASNGKADPWLLVIQCPSRLGPSIKNQVPLHLENAPAGPGAERVIVLTGPLRVKKKKSRHIPLTCFALPSAQQTGAGLSGTTTELTGSAAPICGAMWIRFGCVREVAALPAAGTGSGIATGQVINVTLPTLEADPAAQLTNASTPMYAEETARGVIKDLVEVYQAPGVSCPTVAPTIASPPAGAHPAVPGGNAVDSGSAVSLPSPSPSPSASPSPSPSPSASPSPSPSPSPENGCYEPFLKDSNPVIYHIPVSVETAETLERTNLSGDRVDSMFPPGQIKSDDQIYWQGISGLSPSLNATNLAAEARDSQYSFFAGVLYGLGLSLMFAFIQIVLAKASKSGNEGPGAA